MSTQHQCAAMKIAIKAEWIEQNLLNPAQLFIRSPKKLCDGSKGNKMVRIDFCPWCGKAVSK